MPDEKPANDVRLFVAVRIPPEMSPELLATNDPRIERINPASLHITLRFIGQGDPAALDTALKPVKASPFQLVVRGAGIFERAKILWLDVAENPGLQALYQRVSEALIPAGVTEPTRNYIPHVSVARFTYPADAPEVTHILDQLRPIEFPPLNVSSFVLFNTVGHYQYQALTTYPLT
jgi:RNA 2',3'-cyclic 3'-phosphodiesterase